MKNHRLRSRYPFERYTRYPFERYRWYPFDRYNRYLFERYERYPFSDIFTDRRETLEDERVYVVALVPCGDGGEAKASIIRQTELAALVHVRTAQAGHCAEVRIESSTVSLR